MKKALLVLLALAMIGSFAFADVKVSGLVLTGVKAGLNTVAGTSTNYIELYEGFRGFSTVATMNVSISVGDGMFGYDGRVLVIPSAVVGAPAIVPAGLAAEDIVSPNSVAFDLAAGWWKMFDGMATLSVGNLIPKDFSTPEMNWGDSAQNGAGLGINLKPIEGLEIGYMMPLNVAKSAADLQTAFYGSRIGLAYAMKDMFSVTGGYVSAPAGNLYAYFGLSLSAVKDLGFWVEGLLKNIGNTNTQENDFYVEASYAFAPVTVDVWAEADMATTAMGNLGWVVGPNVSYALMDKVTVSGEFDIGNNNNLGGWYGTQTLGAADPAKGLSWAGTVTCDYASPAGKIRVRAAYQSKIGGDGAMYARLEYRYLF